MEPLFCVVTYPTKRSEDSKVPQGSSNPKADSVSPLVPTRSSRPRFTLWTVNLRLGTREVDEDDDDAEDDEEEERGGRAADDNCYRRCSLHPQGEETNRTPFHYV